ncbi:MAG: nitroreductase family deazaflavin-dependent oxidoreductase [Actinomycetota bacterium]
MPLPRALARFNRIVTNPIAGSFAGRVPPFAVVVHRGRRTGREYRTPVSAFRTDDGYLIALTYGLKTEWVANVLAADNARLLSRGREIAVESPRLLGREEALVAMPVILRPALRVLRVANFLHLRTALPGSPR